MYAAFSKPGHGKFMRPGAALVVGVFMLAVSAALPPARLQLSNLVPFDAGDIVAARFVDDPPPAGRQDAAAGSRQQAALIFGMETETVTGELAAKWHAVEADIDDEQQVLARCRTDAACPVVAKELLDIVAEGSGRSGLARVGLINRAVDLAIAPASDELQWGVADRWSPPFETLRTRRGDCEDYAIVKYVALLEAGLSRDDVKIVILRNLLPNEDHAVVAARVEGKWLILDNRRLALVRDSEMVRSIPEFVLDEDGARRFVPPTRTGQGPNAGLLSAGRSRTTA
jgi:predicted transglutaminase-like cysteine proteinase